MSVTRAIYLISFSIHRELHMIWYDDAFCLGKKVVATTLAKGLQGDYFSQSSADRSVWALCLSSVVSVCCIQNERDLQKFAESLSKWGAS